MAREAITAREVTKVYRARGAATTAVQDFSITVGEGEFLSLIGPSGCGKSTFLRMVAGLIRPTAGEIRIRGELEEGGRERSWRDRPLTAMVFQEYALFPWRTVIENVGFGLEMRDMPRQEREALAARYIEKVGLRRFSGYYPYQLSGGMKQRVGIARAFCNNPEIMLMDEPFGALDAQTRTVLQQELLRIWEEEKKTVLYVTHAIDEAVLLSDRVIVMTAQPGTLKAVVAIDFGRPRDLKLKTSSRFAELEYMIWQLLEEEVTRTLRGET
ncbi:MAG: ABC transporter ATP-binding protein [Deltaproteobacteria bacterium]|nr:ABC transporter ATP-binding protein [Deltaproteobacteria bacterium]MBI3076288.1 ABC transporter ATP-binding protein [Deltaproteobacteria bacterium]